MASLQAARQGASRIAVTLALKGIPEPQKAIVDHMTV